MDGQEGGLLGANSSPEKGKAIRAVAFYIQAVATLEDSTTHHKHRVALKDWEPAVRTELEG